VIKKFLKSVFGGGSSSKPETTKEGKPASAGKTASAPQNVNDLASFVDYVVRALVDKPDVVRIESESKDDGSAMIKINCDKDDIGKVIGKSGKTIMAIRSLVSGAGGRMKQRVSVEIVE